ncbi:hypothetical protein TgHK011_007569 [Trichoderma gracile]|nr:hypothetical protein TgHK011_007569 [Trichoderma gracile]
MANIRERRNPQWYRCPPSATSATNNVECDQQRHKSPCMARFLLFPCSSFSAQLETAATCYYCQWDPNMDG